MNRYLKHFLLLFLFFGLANACSAQAVTMQAQKQTLNRVIQDLSERYELQFSFNEKLLEDCIIDDTKTYPSPEAAIAALTDFCNLSYILENEVFIIFSVQEKKAVKNSHSKQYYSYSGQLTDKKSGEALPFSGIQIGSAHLSADVNGRFSYVDTDSLIRIQASHIGYYSLDTTLRAGRQQNLKLLPQVVGIQEIVVKADSLKKKIEQRQEPGAIRLNPQVATFLPGNRSNTLYSMLRLQAGILAAGETTDDFVIWGSYKGENLLIFDGMTLFGMSYHENIGLVNPLIIKDVEVLKGGFQAEWGERVGGIVNISGKSGNQQKLEAEFDLNNLTANAYLNIPIGETAALQAAIRSTYFNQPSFKTQKGRGNQDLEYFDPKHRFLDGNIKLAGKRGENDHYSLSLLASNDLVSGEVDEESDEKRNFTSSLQQQQQFGGSFYYGKNWKKAGTSSLKVSASNLNSRSLDSLFFFDRDRPDSIEQFQNFVGNAIQEFSAGVEHQLPSTRWHSLRAGVGIVHNAAYLQHVSTRSILKDGYTQGARINVFIKDKFFLHKKIHVQPGLRLAIPMNGKGLYWQPRFDANIYPFKNLNIHLAWGLYKQFINQVSVVDNNGTYNYYWDLGGIGASPVLNSEHYLLGCASHVLGIEYTLETYYKTTTGQTRFLQYNAPDSISSHAGYSRTYGLNFSLQKTIRKHQFSLSYSLSQLDEYFDYFAEKEYQAAPQDQRHELKAAAILQIRPFYASVGYVYGSGVDYSRVKTDGAPYPYSRLDLAFLYPFKVKKLHFETGFSILNVLNQKNIRFGNSLQFEDDKQIYARATPFSPSLFIKIRW